MKCQVAKPYPKIRVTKKSLEYAKILSHLYASNVGELNAVTKYSYQVMISENEEIK